MEKKDSGQGYGVIKRFVEQYADEAAQHGSTMSERARWLHGKAAKEGITASSGTIYSYYSAYLSRIGGKTRVPRRSRSLNPDSELRKLLDAAEKGALETSQLTRKYLKALKVYVEDCEKKLSLANTRISEQDKKLEAKERELQELRRKRRE